MKKDVLFLCQFFYPEYVSSATLPYDTAVALKNAGLSVDALCGYPKEYAREADLPTKETVEGIGIAIEKGFQDGGRELRESGVDVRSLAIIETMTDDALTFREQN